MEKLISDEEKIRRAIEISQRRNKDYYTRETARVSVNNKKDYKLFKKMILQIIICLLIYLIFYLISTTNYVFSEQVLKTTTQILNYDINLEKIYKDCQNFVTSIFSNDNNESNVVDNIITNNTIITITNVTEENIVNTSTATNTIVNKVEQLEVVDNEKDKQEQEKDKNNEKKVSDTKKDAEKVKKICEFQKPLSGTITSEFGEREVILNGMTSDHKGIDIAAKSGTNIKAAMSGTVIVAEENSEYGKFIKIENGEVMTVYAHCKSLKVKKGEKVKKGKVIATVGSTGVSTGPHLHFEIRLSGRYINPRYVIKF